MNRRGFSLAELLLTLTITAVLGLTLVRILINDSRFVSRQDALMSARQGARAALNSMAAELRMVSDGGVVADSVKKLIVRIPVGFGLFCGKTGNVVTAMLLPTDSLTYYTALSTGISGIAYRKTTGPYSFPTASSWAVATSTNTAACRTATDTVKVLTGSPAGKLIDITAPSISPFPAAPIGRVFYLYQNVSYYFANSTDASLSGRKALFRQAGSAAAEEIVAPFDTASGFRCLQGVNLSRVDCPIATANVRGVELKLISASEKNPQGASRPATFNLTTRIVFSNN